MASISSAQLPQFKQTPFYKRYVQVAPHPDQFGLLIDRMGQLMKKDYDWHPEIARLRMPTLLLFADHDAVSMKHIAEFFALFGGGVRDAGYEGQPHYARARLAIVPGYTHYNFGMGPGHRSRDRGLPHSPDVQGNAVRPGGGCIMTPGHPPRIPAAARSVRAIA